MILCTYAGCSHSAHFAHVTGLDPEGLKTGWVGVGIDCRKHVSSGVSRERGRVWEGVPPLIRGSGCLPREIFKTRLPESAFPCYFQVSLILQADFISFSVNFRRSRVQKLLGQHSFVGSLMILSLPPTDSRRAFVSFWQKNCTVLVNHLCISFPRKCGYVNCLAQK